MEAVRCWTNDPCGAAEGEPGTASYAARLVESRREHAPWIADALGYDTAAGLDVLDVGCGQGIDLIGFARRGACVTGIDLTPRHVELARAHLETLGLCGEVVEGDAEQMSFPDASFDRVTSNGVLHHTPDMPAALREIRRVLRPDGDLRLIVYNRRSLHYLQHALIETRLKGKPLLSEVERTRIGARPLVRPLTRHELRVMLRDAGFKSASVSVRHFDPSDTSLTHLLRPVLRSGTCEWIGRRVGWYLVATAR